MIVAWYKWQNLCVLYSTKIEQYIKNMNTSGFVTNMFEIFGHKLEVTFSRNIEL